MIQESEVLALLLGIGVFVFLMTNRTQLFRAPYFGIIHAAFYAVLVGWILTILEGFLWEETLNFLEHFCYMSSSVLLAVWTWRVVGK